MRAARRRDRLTWGAILMWIATTVPANGNLIIAAACGVAFVVGVRLVAGALIPDGGPR